jgi:hypothetical protein
LDGTLTFVEPPRVEWRRGRPFAFARLPEDYARELEALAHRLSPELDEVEPKPDMMRWAGPYGSRFAGYNIFLLDPAYLPLFWAMRATYRTLIEAMKVKRRFSCVRGWLNIQKHGEHIGRHLHEAQFIGTFAARAEGSETRFGLLPDRTDDDIVIENVNGQLLLTFGLSHYHETSAWERSDAARVTYAVDIVPAEQWKGKSLRIPFDGPPLPFSGVESATGES